MRKDKNILEIVIFLFKNCLQNNGKLPQDKNGISIFLRNFGFRQDLIDQALEWVIGVEQDKNFIQEPSENNVHIFTLEEGIHLNSECQRFLFFLEQQAILNAKTRELVIYHLLRLNQHSIDVIDIKWVALIVLYSQPKERAALLRLEQMLLMV